MPDEPAAYLSAALADDSLPAPAYEPRSGGGLASIGELFAASGVNAAAEAAGIVIARRPPSGDQLLDPRTCPPRAECAAALALLDAELAKWHATPQRAELERRRRLWAERLEWNAAKAALAEGRPAGCWCLGFGSRMPRPAELDPLGPPAERVYCDGCDAGREAAARAEEARARNAARYEQARIAAAWKSAAIPDLFRDLTFDSYLALPLSDSQRRAAARVRAWTRAGDWLLLQGPTGTGKTALACIALRALMDAGASGMFAAVPDLLAAIRATFNKDSGTTDARITAALEDAQVLLLDDLGVENRTAWVEERLYRLVNARHLSGRRTILTTNLSLAELKLQVGDRCLSRIGGHLGRTGQVKVEGEDLRMVGFDA